MNCSKCGKVSFTGRNHAECPRPDMKLMSREEHDETLAEIEHMEAEANRLLTCHVPVEGFSVAWGMVLAGQLPLSDLHESLMDIGRTTGLGKMDGMDYKRIRNGLDEIARKTTVKLRMTALSMGERKPKKKLGINDLRAKEARA